MVLELIKLSILSLGFVTLSPEKLFELETKLVVLFQLDNSFALQSFQTTNVH